MRQWPAGIRTIARKHVKPERLSKDYGGQAMQELMRQIETTDRKAEKLAKKGRLAHEECAADLGHRIEDNFDFIHELDKLRKERKDLIVQVKEFELKVQTAEKLREQQAARQAAALEDAARPMEDDNGGFANSALDGFFGGTAASQVGNRTLKPSGSSGTLRQSGIAHRSPEERRAMQKLLAAADLRNQQVQFQALERKLLKDQLAHLESEAAAAAEGRERDLSAASPAKPAAGAGLAAARRSPNRT